MNLAIRVLATLAVVSYAIPQLAADHQRPLREQPVADESAKKPIPAALHESYKRSHIDPTGINGSLVFAGREAPDAVLDRFYMLAKGGKAHIVMVRLDASGTSRTSVARLQDYWKAKQLESLDISAVGDDQSVGCEALKRATGVWLVAEDMGSLRDSGLREPLAEVLSRGGVVGGFALNDELSLLPDSIVVATDADAATVQRQVAAHPRRIGYKIDSDAAMLVSGRRIRTIGDGRVHIYLARTKHLPARSIELNGSRDRADLTALRYAALDRLGPKFPADQPPKPRVENGTLIIIGGGGMPKGIISKFVEIAGGKEAKIVVLPTAMPDPVSKRSRIAASFRKLGAGSVTVLPGRTRSVVESEEYLARLREATGIWFGGGRQWRFADAYLGTRALPLMHAVLARGGVIMGSSAGASIQADYLARANPLGNRDIMAEGYERGLGFLKGVAIDQHFAQRRRFQDMTTLVNRYPQLLGIGIDEGTAIIVQKNIASVVGRGGVHFYDRGKPVLEGKADYETVKHGGRFDLVGRRVLQKGGTSGKEKDDSCAIP